VVRCGGLGDYVELSWLGRIILIFIIGSELSNFHKFQYADMREESDGIALCPHNTAAIAVHFSPLLCTGPIHYPFIQEKQPHHPSDRCRHYTHASPPQHDTE